VVKRDARPAVRSGHEIDAGTLGQWEMNHRTENFVESRTAGSVEMFEVSQPAGSFPDPAMPVYNLQIVRRCLGHASAEFGGHRFGGVPVPGDMVLSPSNQACSYTLDASNHVVAMPLDERLVRQVADELVPTFAGDFGDLHTRFLSSAAVCQSALMIWHSAKPGAGKTFDGHAATIELIELLLRFSVSPSVLRRQRHHIAPTALHRVMHYVEAYLAEDVSLPKLADIAGLSQYHFLRSFKAEVGETPHQYVIRQRVARATDLLRRTSVPLTTIAASCGFSSHQHMCAVLGKVRGVSPRDIRARAIALRIADRRRMELPASPFAVL
jgi:AraC family transcriptional regulator